MIYLINAITFRIFIHVYISLMKYYSKTFNKISKCVFSSFLINFTKVNIWFFHLLKLFNTYKLSPLEICCALAFQKNNLLTAVLHFLNKYHIFFVRFYNASRKNPENFTRIHFLYCTFFSCRGTLSNLKMTSEYDRSRDERTKPTRFLLRNQFRNHYEYFKDRHSQFPESFIWNKVEAKRIESSC